jgi:hypothetical protein
MSDTSKVGIAPWRASRLSGLCGSVVLVSILLTYLDVTRLCQSEKVQAPVDAPRLSSFVLPIGLYGCTIKPLISEPYSVCTNPAKARRYPVEFRMLLQML